MTLRDELEQDPLGIGYAAMTNAEIETSLNAKTRYRLQTTNIGEGTILATLGLTAGNAFLDVIDAHPDFRHVKKIVARGEFDMSAAVSQAGVQGMVPAVLTQAQADALKALAQVPCSRAEELGVKAFDSDIRKARA